MSDPNDSNQKHTSGDATAAPGLPTIDVLERGGKRDGERQSMDRRLFMQLLVLDVPQGEHPPRYEQLLTAALTEARIPSVLYADVNSPRGFGLLTWSEDPSHFVAAVRPLLHRAALSGLVPRRDFAMLGRTYSTGHEPDLEFMLLQRPLKMVLNPEYPWAVWYPLRRNGAFARLEPHEQSMILREHAAIGMAYGQQELAHDVRLACHGMDANDNEFVVGLLGRNLHPLSHVVQSMRKTKQTAEYISQMGPFFVGYALHRVSA